MVNFLTSILNALPESQQQAIGSLIAKKKKIGEITSLRNQQSEILRLYSEIKDALGSILLNPRTAEAGSRISSEDHNYNMEKVYLDLTALYQNIDKMSKVFMLQSTSLDSEYLKARAAIEKLLNDAKVFATLKKYSEFNDVKVIDFNSSSNNSKVIPKAFVNPRTRLLQLRSIGSTRIHLPNRENRITKIYSKTISTGIKSSLSKSFPLENIADQKPETFWATLVMTDYPVKQVYTTNSQGAGQSQSTLNGPVVEVYLRFSHFERVNYIRLLPFADMPIKIVDISYRLSNESDIFVTIKDFNQSTTLDWEEYNFLSIFTNEIKISLCQENAKLMMYQLPEGLVKNTDVFQKIYDSKLSSIVGKDIIDSDAVVESARAGTIYEEASRSLSEAFKLEADQLSTKNKIDYYYNFNKVISEVLSKIDPAITQETIFGSYSAEELSSDKLIQVKKFEYIIGIREAEIGYSIYAPFGYFATEKFEPKATVAQIQLEVDERHPEFVTEWERDYRKTSTEWSIDLGEGRVVPIHPRNILGDNNQDPFVKDELIRFDASRGLASTRLGCKMPTVTSLKKDGQIIPETEYVATRFTGSVPYVTINMTGSQWYDPNSIYTVDYFVDQSSYLLDVLANYPSRELVSPEIFTGTNINNDVTVSKYPYIDYSIMNLKSLFATTGKGNWVYVPPQNNVFSGQVKLRPTIIDRSGLVLQTGQYVFSSIRTQWGSNQNNFLQYPARFRNNPDLNPVFFGASSGINYGYYLSIMDSSNLYHVDSFIGPLDVTGLLKEQIVLSVSDIERWQNLSITGSPLYTFFSGTISGSSINTPGGLSTVTNGEIYANYTLGVGVRTEDNLFANSNNTYTPIEVYVNDRLASNITDYYKLQHPAFSSSLQPGTDYEYIQAGKKLYFNQKVDGEIKVDYKWMTDYVRVQGVLRSNSPISPELTPKVNEVRLLINNSVI